MAFTPSPAAPAAFPAPSPPLPRTGPSTAVGLALLGVLLVADLLLYVLPQWFFIEHRRPLSSGVTLGLGTILVMLYAGLLAAIGRTTVRRLAAAVVAVAVIPVHVALDLVLSGMRFDDIRDVAVLTTTVGTFVALAHLAAWGVARREGALWLLGLVALPVAVGAQWMLRDGFNELVHRLVGGLSSGELVVASTIFWVWTTAPVLLTGVLCFAIDRLTSTNATTARHPHG